MAKIRLGLMFFLVLACRILVANCLTLEGPSPPVQIQDDSQNELQAPSEESSLETLSGFYPNNAEPQEYDAYLAQLPPFLFYFNTDPVADSAPRFERNVMDNFYEMSEDNVPAGTMDFARCHYDDYYGKKHHHHHDKHWKKKYGLYDMEDDEKPEKEDHNVFLYNYNAQPSYSPYGDLSSAYGRYYRSADPYQAAPEEAPVDYGKLSDRYDDYEIENNHNTKYKYKHISKYASDGSPTYYETSYSVPTIQYNGASSPSCPCKSTDYQSAVYGETSPYSRSAQLFDIPRFSRGRSTEAAAKPDWELPKNDEIVGCHHDYYGKKHHHKKYYMDDDDEKEKDKSDDSEPSIYIYNSNIPKLYRGAEPGFADLGKGFVDFAGQAGGHLQNSFENDGKKVLDIISQLSNGYLNALKPLGSGSSKRAAEERYSYPGVIGKPFLGLLKNPYGKHESNYDLPYHADFALKINHNHDELVSKYGKCPLCGKSGKSPSYLDSPYLTNVHLPPQLKKYGDGPLTIEKLLSSYKPTGGVSSPLTYAHEAYPSGASYGKGLGVASGSYGYPSGASYGKGQGVAASGYDGDGYGSPHGLAGYSNGGKGSYGSSNLGLYGSPAYGIKKSLIGDNQPVYSVVDHPATAYTSSVY